MDLELAKVFGQVAGIGGLSLAVFLYLGREFIRRRIFPTLSSVHAYQLIRLFLLLTAGVTVFGIGAWVYAGTQGSSERRVERPKETPERLARTYIELVDAGRYGEAWDMMASDGKKSVPRETFISLATTVRGALGKVVSRKMISSSPATDPPGYPKGPYHAFTYLGEFDRAKGITEYIYFSVENGKWAPLGYLINNPDMPKIVK